MIKTIALLFITSLISFVSTSVLANVQLDREISVYLDAFESNSFAQMKEAMDEMKWKGITDDRIYDAMLAQFKKTRLSDNKIALNQTAHLARGLALSGSAEYKAEIEKALKKSPHKSLVEEYEQALKDFDNYARWNPVISANLEQAKDIHIQRITNMLTSDHVELIAQGARGVHDTYYTDPILIEQTAQRLTSFYMSVKDDKSVDVAVLLCKALARSRMNQYKALLEKIAETAEDKELRKQAEKLAEKLK